MPTFINFDPRMSDISMHISAKGLESPPFPVLWGRACFLPWGKRIVIRGRIDGHFPLIGLVFDDFDRGCPCADFRCRTEARQLDPVHDPKLQLYEDPSPMSAVFANTAGERLQIATLTRDSRLEGLLDLLPAEEAAIAKLLRRESLLSLADSQTQNSLATFEPLQISTDHMA
jgi:hypothetical protein